MLEASRRRFGDVAGVRASGPRASCGEPISDDGKPKAAGARRLDGAEADEASIHRAVHSVLGADAAPIVSGREAAGDAVSCNGRFRTVACAASRRPRAVEPGPVSFRP